MYKKLLRNTLLMGFAMSLAVPQAYAARSDQDESGRTREPATATGTSVDQASNKTVKTAKAAKRIQASEIRQLQVSTSLLSMTEERDVEVQFPADESVNLENLEWTLGGKSFEEWRKYSAKEQKYSGEPFLTFSKAPYRDGDVIKATIHVDLVYTVLNRNGEEVPTSDMSPRSIRRKFNELLGTYELAVKDKGTDTAYTADMKLNVYDNYHTYEEIKPAIDQIMKDAKKDRYVKYDVIGKSVEGRDLHFVVLAKDRKSVETYLNRTLPKMKSDPEKLSEDLEKGKLKDYKVPVWFNNPHPDETPAMDAMLELLRQFATEDIVEFNASEETDEVKRIEVDEALDNMIFLFNLSQNPDGRVATTRANANKFDLNRDHTYQTQPEVLATVEEIAKWTPLSFYDFHGFVSGFLIEPCTPPHNPNFEYDLLMKGMIDQAHAMGNAGIANTKYEDYLIPLDDYGNGWDDYTPAYTAVYAMTQGSFGHTIEMPEMNQDSFHATVYAGLGGVKYVLDNKDEMFKTQLEIFKRGVDGEDNRAVDEWLVNQDGEEIGRPRGENDNFFPEYYVIPMDPALQKNPWEAANMIEYLLRNDVEIKQTTKEIKADGNTYPKGTYVVDMHQAKRGFANAVLFDGEDISDWEAMYDSVVQNFHDLRGFTRYELRDEGVFDKNVRELKSKKVAKPKTDVPGKADAYIIRNTSNEAIKAVNYLLDAKKNVEMVLESGEGYEIGDFLVEKRDLDRVRSKYYLDVIAAEEDVKTEKLKMPKVASVGSGASKFVLEELGFDVVSSVKSSDVIVDDSGNAEKKDLDGRAYIGIGGYALEFVKEEDILDDFDFGSTDFYHEGLLRAQFSQDSAVTAAYDEEELVYSASGSWITEIPEDAQTLITVSDERDYFKTGWWPGHDDVKGQVMAFTLENGDEDITLFANDLVWRAHPQFSYRMLANAIYATTLDE